MLAHLKRQFHAHIANCKSKDKFTNTRKDKVWLILQCHWQLQMISYVQYYSVLLNTVKFCLALAPFKCTIQHMKYLQRCCYPTADWKCDKCKEKFKKKSERQLQRCWRLRHTPTHWKFQNVIFFHECQGDPISSC